MLKMQHHMRALDSKKFHKKELHSLLYYHTSDDDKAVKKFVQQQQLTKSSELSPRSVKLMSGIEP